MPIYEYSCLNCGSEFEKLVRSVSAADEVTCPTCSGNKVKRKMSLVAAKGGSAACSTCSTGCTSGST